MQTFTRYFNEQVSTSINLWQRDLNLMLLTYQKLQTNMNNADYHDSLRADIVHQINTLHKDIILHVKSISHQAYAKLYRFHELEYKLHLLNSEYKVPRLIEFTKYEINELYKWIKIFLTSILDTRVLTEPGDNEYHTNFVQKISSRDFRSIDSITKDSVDQAWTSIEASYYLLKHAVTLPDKLKAVSIVLNAYHDEGKLFGGSLSDSDSKYYFAPFTTEQFDNLSNINPNKIRREITKEIV